MTKDEVLHAYTTGQLITEPKRNGTYRLLGVSDGKIKQQDGTWASMMKYFDISNSKVFYYRTLDMFGKFKVANGQ